MIMQPILTQSCTVITAEGPIKVFVTLNSTQTFTVSVLHYYETKPQAPHFIEDTRELACQKCSEWIMTHFTPPYIIRLDTVRAKTKI